MKLETVVFVVLAHSEEMSVRMLENFSKVLLRSGLRNNEVKAEYNEEHLLAALEYELDSREIDSDYLLSMADGYFGLSFEFVKFYSNVEN